MSSTIESSLQQKGVFGATWTVGKATDLTPADSESTFTIGDYGEAVFEPDNRKPVDPSDYQDGGKYRCECALPTPRARVLTEGSHCQNHDEV